MRSALITNFRVYNTLLLTIGRVYFLNNKGNKFLRRHKRKAPRVKPQNFVILQLCSCIWVCRFLNRIPWKIPRFICIKKYLPPTPTSRDQQARSCGHADLSASMLLWSRWFIDRRWSHGCSAPWERNKIYEKDQTLSPNRFLFILVCDSEFLNENPLHKIL